MADEQLLQSYKDRGFQELTEAIDPNRDDWQKVAVRLIGIEGYNFGQLQDELEDRFLVTPRGGSEVTVIVSLHPSKRQLLVDTVARCGYRIKDAHKM
jgi:hypothetical protein